MMRDDLSFRSSMGRISLDWLEENNYENPYVQKWLSRDFLPEIRRKLIFRGLLNHRDIKKEFTESYAAFHYSKQLLKRLSSEPQSTTEDPAAAAAATVDEPQGSETTRTGDAPEETSPLRFDRETGEGLVVFDLCSGKGFAAVLFSYRFPQAKIYMIDKDKRMNVDHVEALPNVEMKYLDLVKNTRGVREFMRRECADRVGLVVGNHLCGDLSEICVEFFNSVGRLRAMVLAPCCLSKRNKPIVETAAKLKIDNYDYWTLYLHQGVCCRCSKTITRDEHVCSIKNNYILALKPPTYSAQDVDLPPLSDRSVLATQPRQPKAKGNWKANAKKRKEQRLQAEKEQRERELQATQQPQESEASKGENEGERSAS